MMTLVNESGYDKMKKLLEVLEKYLPSEIYLDVLSNVDSLDVDRIVLLLEYSRIKLLMNKLKNLYSKEVTLLKDITASLLNVEEYTAVMSEVDNIMDAIYTELEQAFPGIKEKAEKLKS